MLLAQGWAHYRGPAGDTSFHAHYPIQLVYADERDASVSFEDRVATGRILSIPSNVSHKLSPREDVIDLLYIEPSLMAGVLPELRSLHEWLAVLDKSKTCIDDVRMVHALEAIDENLRAR